MDQKIEEFWGVLRKKYEDMNERDFPGYYLSNNVNIINIFIRMRIKTFMINQN